MSHSAQSIAELIERLGVAEQFKPCIVAPEVAARLTRDEHAVFERCGLPTIDVFGMQFFAGERGIVTCRNGTAVAVGVTFADADICICPDTRIVQMDDGDTPTDVTSTSVRTLIITLAHVLELAGRDLPHTQLEIETGQMIGRLAEIDPPAFGESVDGCRTVWRVMIDAWALEASM